MAWLLKLLQKTEVNKMPGGRNGGSAGGHFGGGSVTHGGGHVGGPHGGPVMVHRPWYAPRVMIFGGRTVYLGSGRASAVSVLGVLAVFALIVTIFSGIGWGDAASSLKTIKADYRNYQAMAQVAAENGWIIEADLIDPYYEQYGDSGKYCIYYSYVAGDGSTIDNNYSFYVYDYNQVTKMMTSKTVWVALETAWSDSNKNTDSVPLDFKDAVLDDDVEYVAYNNSRNAFRTGTIALIVVTVALAVSAVMVPLTAAKATAEQIAESKTNPSGNATNTWRCEYCGSLNANDKQRCDACGAKRQK